MVIHERYLDRSSETINAYLNDVAKIKLLTTAEELEYGLKAKEGDVHAKNILVKSNLRFVISVAKQFQNNNVPITDLINEGNIGLIEAVNKFDPTMGYKLISYAIFYIRRNILSSLQGAEKPYHLPINKAKSLSKLYRHISTLETRLEREVTLGDIYGTFEDYTDIEVTDLYSLMLCNKTSLQKVVGSESEFTLENILPSKSHAEMERVDEKDYNKQRVINGMTRLKPRYRDIISDVYGLNGRDVMSTLEISDKYDMSRQRVYEITKIALRILKGNI